jgi:hypothetical protein
MTIVDARGPSAGLAAIHIRAIRAPIADFGPSAIPTRTARVARQAATHAMEACS